MLRHISLALFLISIAVLNTQTQALSENPTDKPNIVLMMSDDQGWGQTGYNNHPILKTPNLDAMAAGSLNRCSGVFKALTIRKVRSMPANPNLGPG